MVPRVLPIVQYQYQAQVYYLLGLDSSLHTALCKIQHCNCNCKGLVLLVWLGLGAPSLRSSSLQHIYCKPDLSKQQRPVSQYASFVRMKKKRSVISQPPALSSTSLEMNSYPSSRKHLKTSQMLFLTMIHLIHLCLPVQRLFLSSLVPQHPSEVAFY